MQGLESTLTGSLHDLGCMSCMFGKVGASVFAPIPRRRVLFTFCAANGQCMHCSLAAARYLLALPIATLMCAPQHYCTVVRCTL